MASAKYQSEIVTRGIRVSVISNYSEDQSDPDNHQWLYFYTVTIANESDDVVQLIGRHWYITDSNGKIQEVVGKGVVGEQPVIGPGQKYQYTSACPLATELGTMHGSYHMATQQGIQFDAVIAPFSLTQPDHILH